jgi:selenocysteine lyase/cysteine desulfurase
VTETERRLGRSEFLAGAAASAAALTGFAPAAAAAAPPVGAHSSWAAIRKQFDLAPGWTNLSTFLLASHPKPVRDAIDRHRRGLDRNSHAYIEDHQPDLEDRVVSLAAAYLKTKPALVALTDSTTMGLGLLYGGLKLRTGDDVLTSTHDFYSTHESLRLSTSAAGATLRKVPLYKSPAHASIDEIVTSVKRALKPQTRVVALTWVHSSTGVKLPVKEIAAVVREVSPQALLCIDGVHALGIEATSVNELGCDFLVAGTHKWLFGPRGTGLVWGREAAWSHVSPIIPSFDGPSIRGWLFDRVEPDDPGPRSTPGGYHSFEHRWALADAFAFRAAIGAKRVEERTHALATRLKHGLRSIKSVTLQTPLSSDLSAGLVVFSLESVEPNRAVDRLAFEHRIVATTTPYATQYVRLGPSMLNSEADVDRALAAIRKL